MKRKLITRKPLPHMLCAACGAKVARDAYYCKKCEVVVDATDAPGMKLEDTRVSSRLIAANREHLFRNLFLFIAFIIFVITGVQMGSHYLSVVKDNNSSSTFELTVDAPTKPLQCSGPVCHLLIDLRNKTNTPQHIIAEPSFLTASGTHLPHSDPTLLGTGNIYCQPKIDLIIAARTTKKYIGVCTQGASHGSTIALVELTDAKGALVVSGKAASLVP